MGIPSSQLYQLWFPGETLWELWLIGRGKRPELLERSDDFTSLRFRPRQGHKILALPTNRQLAIPFRSDASKRKWVHGDAKAHLKKNFPFCDREGMGLQILSGKPPQSVIRIDAPAVHSARSLPDRIDPEFVVAAPTLIPLPEDSIAIWKELGRQVVAFESNGKTAYYEELPAGTEFETCLVLQKLIRKLESGKIISTPREIHLWNRTSPNLFQSRLKLPTKNDFRPAPSRIKGSSAIRPSWLRMLRDRITKKRKRRTALLCAGTTLIALSAILIGFSHLFVQQNDLQQARLAELRPEVDRIRTWKAQWKELSIAVDRDDSILEIWRRLFAIPSADDIRISRMQVDNGMIELRGEARTVPEALRFLDDVSRNSSLSSFDWDFKEPELRRDGTAYFELVGIK